MIIEDKTRKEDKVKKKKCELRKFMYFFVCAVNEAGTVLDGLTFLFLSDLTLDIKMKTFFN